MALGDSRMNLALAAAQLYGTPDPSLAPPEEPNPWSWVPPHWNEPPPVELLAPDAPVQNMPAPAAVAAPPELPLPFDAELAGNPALPPPELEAPPAAIRDLPDFTVGYEPPAPLPPPVDAISGGPPPTGSTPTPEQAYQAVTTNADNPLAIADPALRQRALNEIAQRDPQKFAEIMLRHEDDRRKFLEARRIETINRDYDEQIANLKMRQEADRITQQKTEELLADSQRIANTKIDPTGGVTGLRRVAGVIGAIVGGIVQGQTGSARNAGMDALNDTINRGIEAQKADLENQRAGIGFRRSALADEYARHGNMFQATETVRLAALKHADDLFAIEQQNFDPQGTMGLRIAATRAGIAAEQQKGVQAYQQKRFDNEIKLQDAARQQAIADETARHNKATEGISRAELGKNAQTKFTPQELQALHPGLPVPPIGMTQKEYGAWLEAGKTGQELVTKTRANSPEERNRELAVPGVVDNTGQLVQFASKEFANDVSNAKETADEITRLGQELIRMVEKNGWSSEFVKSEEWRNAVSNYNEILIRKKEQDKLGVLTGPDVGIVTKEIGTEDPTELRGQQVVGALKHFLHNQVEGFNAKIRNKAILAEGRTLARWEPPPSPPPAGETDADKALKAVLDRSSNVKPSSFTPSGDIRPVEPTAPAPSGAVRAGTGAGRAVQTGLAYQLEILDMYAAQAQSDDPALRAAAVSNLGKAAGDEQNQTGAKEKQVRDRARQILTNMAGAGIAGSPEEIR